MMSIVSCDSSIKVTHYSSCWLYTDPDIIPSILWNPKVHYHIHKRLPPVPIMSQLNLVHTPTSHFLKIHLNILPSTSWSPQWSLSPQASPPTSCAHLYPSPYAPHALPVSFVSILPPAQDESDT